MTKRGKGRETKKRGCVIGKEKPRPEVGKSLLFGKYGREITRATGGEMGKGSFEAVSREGEAFYSYSKKTVGD